MARPANQRASYVVQNHVMWLVCLEWTLLANHVLSLEAPASSILAPRLPPASPCRPFVDASEQRPLSPVPAPLLSHSFFLNHADPPIIQPTTRSFTSRPRCSLDLPRHHHSRRPRSRRQQLLLDSCARAAFATRSRPPFPIDPDAPLDATRSIVYLRRIPAPPPPPLHHHLDPGASSPRSLLPRL